MICCGDNKEHICGILRLPNKNPLLYPGLQTIRICLHQKIPDIDLLLSYCLLIKFSTFAAGENHPANSVFNPVYFDFVFIADLHV